ncbi:MAG: hypothetical protein CVU71_17225 [Deltaproteobacteria bacterium HGW-Deltaproteobacteria-6]|jgi:phospholipase/carboxylesterase|nr:MAG: hypothetical protein CVU71_17225 [Deltaproteobacteria bacterium HGW-Deltaproteobacteria-6]
MNPETIAKTLIQALTAFEAGLRRLNPVVLSEIREGLLVYLEPLAGARQLLVAADKASVDENVLNALLRTCDFTIGAVRKFADEEDLQAAYISALRASRKYCRALEALFPLCAVLPEVNRYFLEDKNSPLSQPGLKAENADAGLFHIGSDRDLHARGGYSLYIPETCTPGRSWPLVVALHGGYGHGRDFIWTWLRFARSRGFVLFAPTSQAMTWSITNVKVDKQVLDRHLEQVSSRVPIDRSRMLLTGMSDGGTYALALGISGNSSYPAIAPVSCALPPVDLRYAKGKRILWVHGAQDWIFPVNWAVQASRILQQAGADIKLKVIEDLSHTYPQEANEMILNWFGTGGIR